MKIALLSFEYPLETGFGGIGTYTWYQARALAKLGHEVHVLAGATEPTELRLQEHDGVKVYRFRADGHVMRGFHQLGKLGLWWTKNRLENALSMYRGLTALCQTQDYDIVEMPECGAEGLLINNLMQSPTLVRFHSPAELIMPYYDVRQADHRWCSLLEAAGFRGAGAFSACSRFLAGEVQEKLGLRQPVRVIPNGIDLELFDAEEQVDVRRQFGIDHDQVMIFFSGRMEARKGIHLCREIAANILERYDVAFVFAGQDLFKYMSKTLLPCLQTKKLKGSVHYLGRLNPTTVRSCLKQTDVFLLPSLWENCPYSCLEAMAASRAIVSSDQGGMPELIRDRENGLLAQSEHAASYIRAIEELIEDKTLRGRLGAGARETVEKSFTDVHVARLAVEHYREHVNQQSRRNFVASAEPEAVATAVASRQSRKSASRSKASFIAIMFATFAQLLGRRLTRRVRTMRHRTEDFFAIPAYNLQLFRLRIDGWSANLRGRRRVIASACWNFPIYSQTFVYQELTQLLLNGFALRFLYSKLDSRDQLPAQFSPLWHARRRLILPLVVSQRSYAYYERRMPEKIDKLVNMISSVSGMRPQAVRGHQHFLQAFAFTRMVEAYRPEYLHSYFFYEGTLFTFVASYLLDIPRGVSCYADHMLSDYALKVVPLHLEQCQLVIATSQRIKQELIGIAPQVKEERIIVKPNAINAAHFPVISPEEPDEGRPYHLISVCRIEPKKGLIYLVEAVRFLRDRDIRIEWHHLGATDGSASSKEYAHELRERIKDLKLDGVVHLDGRKSESEIKAFLKRSHVFVAPFIETEYGDKDGIPTSLLEGMASGLPVVGTHAGSIREVIEDGIDGVLVSQSDALSLANAIEPLLCDPNRRRSLGRQAAAKIRRRFEVQVCEKVFHERVRTLIDAGYPQNEH